MRPGRLLATVSIVPAVLSFACIAPPTTDTDEDLPAELSITIIPERASVRPGDTLTFLARASDENGAPVAVQPTWSASGGAITRQGVFVAGEDPGTFSVSVAVGSTRAVADVIVGQAPAPAPPSGDPQPNGPAGSWELALGEEFDGSTLDGSTWTPHYAWWPQIINSELQFYDPDRPRVSGGTLKLTADRTHATDQNGYEYDYTSGAISSHGKFSFTFGVAEMRARLPAGQGLWPAFWTMPQGGGWPPEIDIMENIGDPGRVHFNLHFAGGGHMGAPSFSGLDTREWHTYTVDWRTDRIDWYVDGVLRASYTNAANVPQQAMYLLLNLAVGGSWPGSPDASTSFPATYEIDYVRVWQ